MKLIRFLSTPLENVRLGVEHFGPEKESMCWLQQLHTLIILSSFADSRLSSPVESSDDADRYPDVSLSHSLWPEVAYVDDLAEYSILDMCVIQRGKLCGL